MTNKEYYKWQDVEAAVNTIVVQMYKDQWLPDYIVGITRGGLPIATMLSNLTDVPMYSLDVSFRDKIMGPESNGWIAEDAFGYVSEDDQSTYKSRWDIHHRKKILIVDDINDSGRTFNWIKQDWEQSCLPNEEYAWKSVWNNNVRFATMTDNDSSEFGDVLYCWDTVNKAENNIWLCFPWEYDCLTRGA